MLDGASGERAIKLLLLELVLKPSEATGDPGETLIALMSKSI
jgi:hypothetical protein